MIWISQHHCDRIDKQEFSEVACFLTPCPFSQSSCSVLTPSPKHSLAWNYINPSSQFFRESSYLMWCINFCSFLRRGTSTATGFLLELTHVAWFLDEEYCCEKPEHWFFQFCKREQQFTVKIQHSSMHAACIRKSFKVLFEVLK